MRKYKNITYRRNKKIEDMLGKKPTYKDVAEYLGVSENAVKHYSAKKRMLFKLGLWVKNGLEGRSNENSNIV